MHAIIKIIYYDYDVRTYINDYQWERYAVINVSNDAEESTRFIKFIFSAIQVSRIEVINMRDEKIDKSQLE